MTTAVLGRPSGWPPGMVAGILAGLGAGAFWGTAFVAPLLTPGFSSIDLTVGRFLSCGLLSVLLLFLAGVRREAHLPTLRQTGAALWLSLLGYTGYYLLLVLAIQAAGAALPVLIIGTIPLWIMLLGKPQGLHWRALVPGLLLTLAGLALMMRETAHGAEAGDGTNLWIGILYAVLAMASWTAFGLLNARWLRHHPEVNSTVWANWLGVAAGMGALVIWAVAGTELDVLMQRPGFGAFVVVCAVTGIGSAWIASVLWNMASRRLSPSLAGQLIVSETVFGLIYTFAWSARWPAALQWAACVLFVLGILASIKAHR
ncbi:DMT family transporter [Hydrogenophaga laconesensis]|uniref:Drug/metabolite transporter (DMT)-like permease n=1 Tax=Hydrogenophaga laconesensis TaxID=1805971 RepID=A0ABU1V5Z8_9BURK|nr:DMT family transporter [Hydrogenophaga laconesensis]MDR7092768.1 drug/metabolite transporter (DMT)-like permease [Hydrogenophaga laconesensis]